MAKRNKNGYGKGTFMETGMLFSLAYMSLGNSILSKPITTSGASIHILNALMLKRRFGPTKDRKGTKKLERSDDNMFTLTYKELMKPPFNFTKNKITRSIDELLAKGFIEKVNPGGAYEKDKAIYALVEDWRDWKPGDPPKRVRPKDVSRGYQGKGLGVVENNYCTHARCTPTHTRTLHTPPEDTHTHVAHPIN